MDMLPRPGACHGGVWYRLCRRYGHIPEENMYDRYAYADKLGDAGFVVGGVQSIARYVYPGVSKYAGLRRRGAPLDVFVDLSATEMDADNWLDIGRVHSGLDDYVVAWGDKPAPVVPSGRARSPSKRRGRSPALRRRKRR
jgi:microcystin synthetase protein McyJ